MSNAPSPADNDWVVDFEITVDCDADPSVALARPIDPAVRKQLDAEHDKIERLIELFKRRQAQRRIQQSGGGFFDVEFDSRADDDPGQAKAG